MDEQLNFRALLLRLQDALSDSDRRRFHFILGDFIPADLRDDPNMGNTLKLFETLVNRAKINEQDVGFLIEVFDKIHCHTIVQMLRRHQQSQQHENPLESRLINDSYLDQLLEDDKMNSIPTYFPEKITSETSCSSASILQPLNALNPIQMPLFSVDPCLMKPSEWFENKQSRASRWYKILKRKTSKWSVMLLVFNIIFLAIVIVLFTLHAHLHSSPTRCLDDIYHVKEGFIQGGDGGGLFDDANDYGLIYGDRCISVEIYWSSISINSVRFIYNFSTIQGNIYKHGSHGEDAGSHEMFNLLPNEEINKITVNANILQTNVPNVTLHLITGLRFHTTKGRASQHYGSSTDPSRTESYGGYTLFYVKGKSGKYIDKLQFIWSKTCSRMNSKECMPQ